MNFKFCKIYETVQALRQILLIFVLRVLVLKPKNRTRRDKSKTQRLVKVKITTNKLIKYSCF